MSSPNLNVLTLCGSLLTYSSGFLFAVDERAPSQGGPSTAVLQVNTLNALLFVEKFLLDHDTVLSPQGAGLDSLCRQYPGVWPDFGEDVETVQSVHPAGA